MKLGKLHEKSVEVSCFLLLFFFCIGHFFFFFFLLLYKTTVVLKGRMYKTSRMFVKIIFMSYVAGKSEASGLGLMVHAML